MGQFAKPLQQLKHLFTQTAQSVVVTQEKLDAQLSAALPAGGAPNPHPTSYSIPRTEMDFQFGLEVLTEKGIFLVPLFKKGSERFERHGHHLKFSLVAVSEVPPAPRGDINAAA